MIDVLAKAIARQEGFGLPGRNIPTRMNNPGDLMFAHQVGATPNPVTGADGKIRVYASFVTPDAGFTALKNQIRLDAGRGLTLAQFIRKYAPASDGNDPNSYLAYVQRAMGEQNPARPLAELIA